MAASNSLGVMRQNVRLRRTCGPEAVRSNRGPFNETQRSVRELIDQHLGVFFKYTIVSDEDTNCAPLDPFIRLR